MDYRSSQGNSDYTALSTIVKYHWRTLFVQAAYTWSRAFQAYPEGINTYPYLAQIYGLNAYYHPQRLVINYVWNLPLGHQEGFVGKVTSGWSPSASAASTHWMRLFPSGEADGVS